MKKLFVFGMILILLPIAYSWGISFEKTSFTIKKGDYNDFDLTLQNYVGDEPIKVTLNVSGDTDIVTVMHPKEYYWLPAKTTAYKVGFRIQIPKDAKEEYNFKVGFTNEPLKAGIGIATRKTIPIRVVVPDGEAVEVVPPPIESPEEDEIIEDNQAEKELEEYKEKVTGNAGVIVEKSEDWKLVLGIILPFIVFLIILIFILKRNKKEKELSDLL